jgi:hypothetical protein
VQGKFAEPSDLLALSRGLAINVETNVKNALSLTTGEISVRYDEQHRDGAGAPINIANLFQICIPSSTGARSTSDGGAPAVPARRRQDQLELSLVRPDLVFDDAFRGIVEKVKKRNAGVPRRAGGVAVMAKLRLAPNLTLPVDAVTQTVAILAKRRAGKSYTARRFAEQLYKAGQQIVIVDPKGDWWGIRSSADGKGPGLPVVILGGERGDVPLEVGSGEVVAKLAAEERVSMLLDLSLFRKREVSTS